MKSDAVIYDNNNLQEIEWTHYIDGEKIKNYFLPIMKDPIKYIQNIETEIKLIAVENRLIPFTINQEEYKNSYICSPYNHYVTYAKEEISMLKKPILEIGLKILVNGLSILTKAIKINRIIYLNNWLLSTNLYQNLTKKQIMKVMECLIKTFPQHAIAFRSINQCLNKEMVDVFQTIGFELAPSRYVYISEPKPIESYKSIVKNTIKRDKKLLEKKDIQIIEHHEFKEEDLKRTVDLYNDLYLHKYSKQNPQYTIEYIKHAHQHHILRFKGIKINEKLEGVLGYIQIHHAMACPIFGYNTSLSKEKGLYRMLSNLALQESIQKELYFHQSAGVGQFKNDRGAIGFPEYNAVFVNHLSLKTKLFWKSLSYILNKMAIKLVEKYKL